MNRITLVASAVLATSLSATALASADAAPSHTSHHAKARAYSVTADVNRTEVVVGDKVKIKGTVRPAAAGSKVTLQVKYEGRKWKTIDHAALSAAGKYKFKDKVGSVRERRYRVLKAAGPNRGGGRVTTPKVTAFGWRTLDSLTPVASAGVYEEGMARMNAVSYPSSLKGSIAPGQIDYNLNRDCKQLDAVYGIDDASPLGSSVSLTVVADGVVKHSGGYTLTQAQRVVTDVTGVFRLTIGQTQNGNGIAAVGTPKVLCSF